MSDHWLHVELHGYWHAGTGAGDGAGADAVVQRDEVGLPMLPGSHLRGLLRHALRFAEEELGAIEPPADGEPWYRHLFGSAADLDGATRYDTRAGRVTVGDARLPAAWRAFGAAELAAAKERAEENVKALKAGEAVATDAEPDARDHLYDTLQSTRIEESGLVAPRTLRSMEVAVPMTLSARVEGLEPGAEEALRKALGLVKAVGKHRTRGLGRATLRLSRKEGA